MSDKIAGSITPKSPDELALEQKIAEYEKRCVVADDAIYVSRNMTFLIHGKHPTLIGAESVVAVKLSEMVAMFAPIFGGTILPLISTAEAQVAPKKGLKS